eukprot:9208198-Ditylum_brightwellii.AAC.1
MDTDVMECTGTNSFCKRKRADMSDLSDMYHGKYYLPEESRSYEGCCSPKGFFDEFNERTTIEDSRMLPFAKDLEDNFKNTASH